MMERIMLQEGWRLCEEGSGEWIPVTVPGSVLSGLLAAGRLEDPYDRENEKLVRERLAGDFRFQTTFSAGEHVRGASHQTLVFEGLDTLAEVYLNGVLLGKADNMHRTWRFDCKNILQEKNCLEIRFHSALAYVRSHEASPGKEISYVPTGCIPGNQYIRKAHSMFGWDWGAQLPDMGIWRPVYLELYDTVRIEEVRIRQKHMWGSLPKVGEVTQQEYLEACEEADQVTLQVETVLEGQAAGCRAEAVLTGPNGEETKVSTSVLQQDEGAAGIFGRTGDRPKMVLTIPVRHPRLWWPNGLGGQPLYTLTVLLRRKETDDESRPAPTGQGEDGSGEILDRKQLTVGLRTLEVSRQPDRWGTEFAFAVNGVKIFAMGADYIPEDCIYPWITRDRIEYLIRSSVRANYNMLRVWGGGYYPSDDFYDLCDRCGLIVWQDLMYACNVYDFTREFEENIRQETIDNVRRLRHHACLGLWCGNNELESAWDHWGIADTHSAALKADYIRQFEYLLPRVTQEEDDVTCYWPSSPSSGGCLDNPDDHNRGDCHYWDVWHGLKPFSDYRNQYFRFCSEFGFQSFPERKTIDTFARQEDCNIFSPVMESHQKNGTANGKILSYISENFRYPRDFDSLIYVSQLLQGIAIKAGVEHWRRNRGRCMGALYWQINDNWPVASWASIDYYGRWKALHYMAQGFFAPKAGSIYADGTKAVAAAVNETLENSRVRVTVRIRTTELETLWEETTDACVPAQGSIVLLERDFSDVIRGRERTVFVQAEFCWQDNTRSMEQEVFVPYKHMELRKPEIRFEVTEQEEEIHILLSSDCYAPFVSLELADADAIFSSNYFTLAQREPVTVTVRQADVRAGGRLSAAAVKAGLRIRTLRESYD